MIQILFRLESLHSCCLKAPWSGTFSLFAALSAYAVCTVCLCFVPKYSVNRTAHVSWNALHSLQVPQLSQGTAVRWDEVLEYINVGAGGQRTFLLKISRRFSLKPWNSSGCRSDSFSCHDDSVQQPHPPAALSQCPHLHGVTGPPA